MLKYQTVYYCSASTAIGNRKREKEKQLKKYSCFSISEAVTFIAEIYKLQSNCPVLI